jgi:large subunit ribosomal protein LP0
MNTFLALSEEYKKILVAEAKNVGSRQLQEVRKMLRGKAVILMGKNTMMKKSLQTPSR